LPFGSMLSESVDVSAIQKSRPWHDRPRSPAPTMTGPREKTDRKSPGFSKDHSKTVLTCRNPENKLQLRE
jgi:hypothetical protein